jgi:molecular chaperone Hsp33
MLSPSRLYSFLDHQNGYNVQFMEGQKLIEELVLIHPMNGPGFAYYRETFLGLMPIIFFLKPGESLGIYIDSQNPYFRLKIETNSAGHTRSLLLPAQFNLFPMKITGQVRVTKIFPGNKAPYTSIIELNNVETKDVFNRILKESYQTNSEVIVSELADQSIMVTKLPQLNMNKVVDDSVSRKDYIKKNSRFFHDVFEEATTDIEKIVKLFEERGFAYLGSRMVNFYCPCSKERMAYNLRALYNQDPAELFSGEASLEVVCDYCTQKYQISPEDIQNSGLS